MIVIGTSGGALKALKVLLSGLPKDFPLPVAIVMHRYKDPDDSLTEALQRHSPLPVVEAMDKMPIEPSRVYIGPADYHLLIESDCFDLSVDEPVSYARPSIDVFFESAADAFGSKVIAVVLTGSGQDGARGAALIQKHGGTVIVQDPATADYAMMPAAALASTKTKWVKSLEQIASVLVEMAWEGK